MSGRRSLLYLAFLGAAVFFLLAQMTGAKSAVRALYGLGGYWVAAAVIAQILSYVASGGLIRAAVQLSGESVTLIRGILITLASNTIGTLGVGFVGTAATSYHWVRGGGISRKTAALAGWLPPIINNAVLVALSNWGLIVLLFRHQMSPGKLVLSIVLEILVVMVPIGMHWSVTHQAQITTLTQRILEFWARLRHRDVNTRVLATSEEWFASIGLLMGGNWHTPMLWAVLNAGFDIATLLFLFRAMQHPISTGVLLAGYALPQVVGGMLMLPGGVGAVEATMIGLYATLGTPTDVGFIVVLSYRVISFWIPTLLGLVAAPYLERASLQGWPSAFVGRWISETGAARSNNLNVPPILASPKSHPLIRHALLNDDWKSPRPAKKMNGSDNTST
jgi:glycosyltransferase 2 family protein